jgi:hypothetical protein
MPLTRPLNGVNTPFQSYLPWYFLCPEIFCDKIIGNMDTIKAVFERDTGLKQNKFSPKT